MNLPLFEHFYFIRHGQTEANELGIMAGGSNDLELNSTGHEQAEKAALLLSKKCPDIQTICTSTMIRARQTASYVQNKIQKPVVEIPKLIEWCLGDWEGQPWIEIAPLFLTDANPVNGESRAEFQLRVQSGLTDALKKPAAVLIVAHGGVWYKIQKIFNLPLVKMENCQIFKVYKSAKQIQPNQYEFHEI